MRRSRLRFWLFAPLLLILSGCSFFGSIEWEWTVPSGTVWGDVRLRDLDVPFVGARVYFYDGPTDRSTVTNRSGQYSVTLPEGTYEVVVRTLHDDYKTKLTVRGSELVPLRFWAGAWFDRDLFYGLSGIRRYYFDGDWLRYDNYDEFARWEQSTVSIYFDTYSAPGWRAEQWAGDYFDHVYNVWRSLLKDRIRFQRVYSRSSAHVIVEWVPAGTLVSSDGRRVASVTKYFWSDGDGSLQRVQIQIDEEFADKPGLWESEWARAMGVGFVDDERSLMYPAMLPGQRTYFTSAEARHIQLLYDLPSGLTWSQVRTFAAMMEGASEIDAESDEEAFLGGEPREVTPLEATAGTGFGGHMRTVDGRVIELDPFAIEMESLTR